MSRFLFLLKHKRAKLQI